MAVIRIATTIYSSSRSCSMCSWRPQSVSFWTGLDVTNSSDCLAGHSTAYSFSKSKIARCDSEHPPERPGQMRGLRKPCGVSSLRYRSAVHQFARQSLKSKPKNIRAHRNADGFGENVHKT